MNIADIIIISIIVSVVTLIFLKKNKTRKCAECPYSDNCSKLEDYNK